MAFLLRRDPLTEVHTRLTSRIADGLLTLYCRYFPYHPGKWRIAGVLEKSAREAWAEPRVARCDGLWFELDLRDFVERNIFLKLYDRMELQALRRLLRPGAVVVDVGANIGYYSLVCSELVGAQGHVYAFEPVAQTAKRMARNIELNAPRNISLIRSACGSRCGTVSMLPVPVGNAGKTQVAGSGELGSEVVPITTLDAFVSGSGLTQLDFIKMDIEGFEMEFIAGARDSLTRFHPTLLMELFPSALSKYGTTPEAIIEALQALGYHLKMPTWKGLEPLSSYPSGFEFCNVFAFHPLRTSRTVSHARSQPF